MSNTFGKVFRVTTFGESHGPALGAVIDGCPSRIPISEKELQNQLDRRRPGQSKLTSQRQEADRVSILSGIEKGMTTGAPIALLVGNTDARSSDYKRFSNVPRPAHADLTYLLKYGILAASGGGRASARETAARVAAGTVAEKLLAVRHGVRITAWVSSVGRIAAPDLSAAPPARAAVDKHAVRCPDAKTAEEMEAEIEKVRAAGDSIGGIITCLCRPVPAGWGEPVFDKLPALLAHAMLSIPAAKGFEIGSGFAAAQMRGSEHNDLFVKKGKRLGTLTNNSGGIQGGISNGEPVFFRVAFKPAATIARKQRTADFNGRPALLEGKGRHDPCVVPRAVPIVEAMTALVLADAALRHIPPAK
ncbi:MAG: chorismate synthase [Kiritimatiellae bacterium]|nr:chorismate synthase [Kiritimatiellia bacterium]